MVITLGEHIQAPVDEVFAQVSDLANAPSRISGIKSIELLTDGPVAQGTRFRETRIMFKREATEEMEVTSFESPSHFTLGCENHGCRYHSEFRFTARDAGTDVTLTFKAQPLTFVARILSVLMWPMARSITKHCERDLRDLKAAIEG